MIVGFCHGGVQTGQNEAIHHGQGAILQTVLGGIEGIDVRIQYPERVGVPQSAHELALTLHDSLAVEAVGQPGSGVGVEVPADRVGSVGGESIEGIHGVALGLGHLLSVLVLYVTENDYVLERCTVEEQGGNSEEGIEPTAGLVHCLGDEVGGELCLEGFVIFKGIVMLCEGHGAGVKPAVDNLGHAAHLTAALGTFQFYGIHVGAVEFDLLRALDGHFLQFGDGADGVAVTAGAFPDVQRRTPVTVTADTPILYVLQPVAETALTDGFGDPVDGVVVADQILTDSGHLDEPGFSCVVDQGGVTAPAEGILVLELGCVEEQTALFQIGEHHRIRFLHKYAGEGSFLGHIALGVYKLYEGQIVLAAHVCVICTECGSDVNHTGTVGHGNVVVAGHVVSLLMLLFANGDGALEQRLVFLVFQIGTLVLSEDLVSGGILRLQRTENGVTESLSQIVGVAVGGLYLHVDFAGIYTESNVGGQSPGSGCPGQDVGILALYLKAGDGRALLDSLVALRHLVGGQRGSAARAVGNDLKALVEQILLPNLLQRPPFGLDIIVVVGNVGVLHIRPEADSAGEILPHALVFPNAFLTLGDKGIDTVGFDLLLAVQAKKLLYLQFNGQTVGIPARLTGNVVSLHAAVAGDHILDNAGQHVTDVGLAVGGGGTVVERIVTTALAVLQGLLENVILVPERKSLLFPVHEIQIRWDFLIHNALLK